MLVSSWVGGTDRCGRGPGLSGKCVLSSDSIFGAIDIAIVVVLEWSRVESGLILLRTRKP